MLDGFAFFGKTRCAFRQPRPSCKLAEPSLQDPTEFWNPTASYDLKVALGRARALGSEPCISKR